MIKNTKLSNIFYSIPMIIITVLTLLLMLYVGYNEGKLKHIKFQRSKLATQVGLVAHTMDNYLKTGFPLKQFSGFHSISEMLFHSDPTIENFRVIDDQGSLIFSKVREGITAAEFEEDLRASNYKVNLREKGVNGDIVIEESKKRHQVTKTLRNKSGVVGYLSIYAPKKDLMAFVNQQYLNVLYISAGLSLFFLIVVIIYELWIGKKEFRQKVTQTAYIICFSVMTVATGVAIFNVGKNGVMTSTRALSASMAQRLSAVLELGIELENLSGIEEAFLKYKQSNPEINSIAFTVDGISIFHTDPAKIGTLYETGEGNLEHTNKLILKNNRQNKKFNIVVTVPSTIATDALLSSSKTFIVLFIACCLIAWIFLNAGKTLLYVFSKDSVDMGADVSLIELIDDICDDGFVTKEEKTYLEQRIAEHKTF